MNCEKLQNCEYRLRKKSKFDIKPNSIFIKSIHCKIQVFEWISKFKIRKSHFRNFSQSQSKVNGNFAINTIWFSAHFTTLPTVQLILISPFLKIWLKQIQSKVYQEWTVEQFQLQKLMKNISMMKLQNWLPMTCLHNSENKTLTYQLTESQIRFETKIKKILLNSSSLNISGLSHIVCDIVYIPKIILPSRV